MAWGAGSFKVCDNKPSCAALVWFCLWLSGCSLGRCLVCANNEVRQLFLLLFFGKMYKKRGEFDSLWNFLPSVIEKTMWNMLMKSFLQRAAGLWWTEAGGAMFQENWVLISYGCCLWPQVLQDQRWLVKLAGGIILNPLSCMRVCGFWGALFSEKRKKGVRYVTKATRTMLKQTFPLAALHLRWTYRSLWVYLHPICF